jgi:ATP-dependent Clp protease ATP-binding subunit ClpC
VSRLVGAPPGYVGYEEGGQLTEKVRRKPYSVVLLDEIEKAHPDVFNILLQVLDDGILTDSLGRRVDFKNTILIMTSNIGTRDIKKAGSFGFGSPSAKDAYGEMKSVVEEAMKRVFNPEFLNRIDDTIIFHPLEREHILEIVSIQAQDLVKRIAALGLSVELTKGAKEFLAEKGFDPAYGARPLRRAIQKYLEDPLAEELLRHKHAEGTTIRIRVNTKADELKFVPAAATKDAGTEEEEETNADAS